MIDVSIISQRERERQRLLAVGIVSELERRAWSMEKKSGLPQAMWVDFILVISPSVFFIDYLMAGSTK